jgi:hypothetical protein
MHGTVRDSLHLLYFSLIQDRKGHPQLIFLPFMCNLRHFEICIKLGLTTNYFNVLSFLMASLCISLTSPATLEHLEFNIRFLGCDPDDGFNTFYENLCNTNVWRHLDSIATHPNGSRLQRVQVVVNIKYSGRFDSYGDNVLESNMDKVLKAVLDGLPSLRTKGILFVEAAPLWR